MAFIAQGLQYRPGQGAAAAGAAPGLSPKVLAFIQSLQQQQDDRDERQRQHDEQLEQQRSDREERTRESQFRRSDADRRFQLDLRKLGSAESREERAENFKERQFGETLRRTKVQEGAQADQRGEAKAERASGRERQQWVDAQPIMQAYHAALDQSRQDVRFANNPEGLSRAFRMITERYMPQLRRMLGAAADTLSVNEADFVAGRAYKKFPGAGTPEREQLMAAFNEAKGDVGFGYGKAAINPIAGSIYNAFTEGSRLENLGEAGEELVSSGQLAGFNPEELEGLVRSQTTGPAGRRLVAGQVPQPLRALGLFGESSRNRAAGLERDIERRFSRRRGGSSAIPRFAE